MGLARTLEFVRRVVVEADLLRERLPSWPFS